MSSACYFRWCKYHSSHRTPNADEPLCHEPTCKAPQDDLEKWKLARAEELFKIMEDRYESGKDG
jgi:hypothetical protein